MKLDPTPFPLDHLTRCGVRDAIALVVGDEQLTYRELDELVGRTASALLARGLQPGDRVATWMGKTRLACVMPLAAARAGLVHVPINPVLKHAQAAHILADSGAKLLIANPARLDSLEAGDLADAKADCAGGLAGRRRGRCRRPRTIRTSWPPCSTPPARPAGPRA